MARFKIILEYDGTGLVGWQRQNEQVSVQKIIEDAIYSLSGELVNSVASGRTDAGVHALGQVVHFDLEKDLSEENVRDGLNFYLKEKQVSVLQAEMVDDGFHARFDAKMRYYKYLILHRKAPPVLEKDRVWHVPYDLDFDNMLKASKKFIGNHDFSSFRASYCQAKNPVKTVDDVSLIREGEHIIFEISAKSFLHHMVRNIVGTLVDVGRGKIKAEQIENIIEAKDRKRAGQNAPAQGLYFVKVDYYNKL